MADPVFKPASVVSITAAPGGFIFALTGNGELWQGQIHGSGGRTWQGLCFCESVVWSSSPVPQVITT